jgi:hypothetical protein
MPTSTMGAMTTSISTNMVADTTKGTTTRTRTLTRTPMLIRTMKRITSTHLRSVAKRFGLSR